MNTTFTKIKFVYFDNIVTPSFIKLGPGFWFIKFYIKCGQDVINATNGIIEYGLSYDKTTMGITRNRLVVATTFENHSPSQFEPYYTPYDEMTVNTYPTICHQFLVQTTDVNSIINLNMQLLNIDFRKRGFATDLDIRECSITANQIV